MRYDNKEINDTGLRKSLKDNLPIYLENLVRSKNSILFDIPESTFQPDPSDKEKATCSIPEHRLTRGYPLDSQDIDIARLNQWFSAGPWEGYNTVSRKIDRFWIAFGAPQVEPLFENVVIFTIIMSSVSVSDEV